MSPDEPVINTFFIINNYLLFKNYNRNYLVFLNSSIKDFVPTIKSTIRKSSVIFCAHNSLLITNKNPIKTIIGIIIAARIFIDIFFFQRRKQNNMTKLTSIKSHV